jgi:hypothetical protein
LIIGYPEKHQICEAEIINIGKWISKFALDSRVVCIELFCQRVECLIYTFHGLVVGKKHT